MESVSIEFVEEQAPSQDVMDRTLTMLILERARYESDLYDFLVGPLIQPTQESSFWDPVIVNLNQEQIQSVCIMETLDQLTECSICITDRELFKRVKCCKQLICIDCADNWFNKSVFCPYCKKDLRELI